MKYGDSRVGLVSFVWTGSDPKEPALPEDPGTAHALTDDCDLKFRPYLHSKLSRRPTEVTDIDFGTTRRAACGKIVRVTLPMTFDDDDPSTCRRCAELMVVRNESPAAWQRQQQEMYRRWRKRDERRQSEEHEVRFDFYDEIDRAESIELHD
ncbi:hypothetical protein GS485_11075 [Rhodococcus hoagii]|nr:hypothetical protein [Prescottella equi]